MKCVPLHFSNISCIPTAFNATSVAPLGPVSQVKSKNNNQTSTCLFGKEDSIVQRTEMQLMSNPNSAVYSCTVLVTHSVNIHVPRSQIHCHFFQSKSSDKITFLTMRQINTTRKWKLGFQNTKPGYANIWLDSISTFAKRTTTLTFHMCISHVLCDTWV